MSVDRVLQYEDDAAYVAWFLTAVGAPARFLRGAIYQHPVVQPVLDWGSDRGVSPINYEGRIRARKGKVANKPARGTSAPNWNLEMGDRRRTQIVADLLLSADRWNAVLNSSNPAGMARIVANHFLKSSHDLPIVRGYNKVVFYRAFGRILWKAG